MSTTTELREALREQKRASAKMLASSRGEVQDARKLVEAVTGKGFHAVVAEMQWNPERDRWEHP